MIRGKPTQELCLICGEKADGIHFDVDTCRACAAFFRRSVYLKGQPYVCKSDHRCQLRIGRLACKACRYDRCQKEGMNPGAVQPSRDVIGKKTSSASPSPMPSPAPPEATILSRMATAYAKMEEDRKIIHQRESILEGRGIRLCIQEADKILIRDSPLILRWLLESFPTLEHLSQSHLERFIGACFMSIMYVETAYVSGQRGGEYDSRHLLPSGDYVDVADANVFFGRTDSDVLSGEEAVRTFAPMLEFVNRRVFRPLFDFRLSFNEFLALCALIAWEPGNPMLPESEDDVCRRTRLSVCSELLSIYKSEGRAEGADKRLAGLLTHLQPIQKANDEMMENSRMVKLFDIYATDPKLYELMNIKSA